ncbi:MAG: phospholipase D-like domain-containing protein [Candidatus Aureabacteria bacterium]|nr:phospholipase D-like domain-containing protein [Candidatus Auribacterota bacterium]
MRPRHPLADLAVAACAACLLVPAVCAGSVEVYFNSIERLEKHVKEAFSGAVVRAREGKPATIDIMIFSFTSPSLADSLLRIARDYPSVRIRILANLSQLFREPTSVMPEIEGIISGKLDAYREVAEKRKMFIKNPEDHKAAVDTEFKQIISEYRQRPIKNIEIKYKWFPAFSWDDKEGKPVYDHFHPKATLLHHKSAVVNGELLVTGSYNWSTYAETKNLENLMVIRGEEDRKIVDDFQAEFEAMWNDPNIAKSGPECTALKEKVSEEIVRARRQAGGIPTAPTAAPATPSR